MPPKSRPKRNAGRPRRYAVNNDSQNKILTESASASDLNTSNDEAGPSQPVSSLEARIKHLESVIEQAPIAHEPRQSRSRSKDKNKKRRRTASSSSTSSISSSSSSSSSTDSDRGRSKKRNTTKSRKRHRHSRKSRRSSDRRSSSTDSEYISDSDDNRPLVTFGTKLGKNISSKIKKRIIQHKYINLARLLPTNPDSKKIATFEEWSEAWEIFMAIYCTPHSHLKEVQGLLTYARDIRLMACQNFDWQQYDETFRRDRETTKCSWAEVRYDLHLQFRQPDPPPKPAQTDRPLVTSDGRKLDKGQCYAFHTKGIRCQYGTQCRYSHKCKTCGARHPSYEKCGAYQKRYQHIRSSSGAQSGPTNNTQGSKQAKKTWLRNPQP